MMKKLYHLLQRFYSINWYKTILANLMLLPIRQAIYFPIVIYGRVELKLRRSKIIIKEKPIFGMLSFGRNDDFFISSSSSALFFMLDSTLYINGSVRVSPGCVFRIDGANIKIGNGVAFGGGCKLLCNNSIYIGDDTRFAFNSIICDTDYHFIEREGKVKNCSSNVIIGNGCWIGNSTTVMKGCNLPDNSIVGSKSLINKSFKQQGVYAGTPARFLVGGVKIHDKALEAKIHAWFRLHRNDDEYIMTAEDMEIH